MTRSGRTRAEQVLDEKGEGRANWPTRNELAATVGVNISTFKKWETAGKIPPPSHRTTNGWKLWSPEDAQRIIDWRAGRRRSAQEGN